jgi:hypothetical protein
MKPNLTYLKLCNLYNATNIHELRGNDNILNLEQPTNWMCYVVEYQTGHPSMTIKIYEKYKEENYFLLIAENIFSFSGIFRWQGANFRLLNPDESLAFLRKFSIFENYPNDLLKDWLLVITTINSQIDVTISASDFYIILNEYTPSFIKRL